MSIDLFVQRGAGDKQGEDVVDPLLGSIPVALARGRNELDAKAHRKDDESLETVYRAGVRLGDLARTYETGEVWTGKITGIQHTVSKVGESVQTTTSMQLERPR